MSAEIITAITEIGTETYRTTISSGTHILYADEPLELGGTDSAPDPKILLLSSLGACTAITLRMYANRKEMPLTHIRVELKLHPANNEDHSSTIDREITLNGDLSDVQKQMLLQIANKCPVHKILQNPIHINTSILST